jgi:hypothetical protein
MMILSIFFKSDKSIIRYFSINNLLAKQLLMISFFKENNQNDCIIK